MAKHIIPFFTPFRSSFGSGSIHTKKSKKEFFDVFCEIERVCVCAFVRMRERERERGSHPKTLSGSFASRGRLNFLPSEIRLVQNLWFDYRLRTRGVVSVRFGSVLGLHWGSKTKNEHKDESVAFKVEVEGSRSMAEVVFAEHHSKKCSTLETESSFWYNL